MQLKLWPWDILQLYLLQTEWSNQCFCWFHVSSNDAEVATVNDCHLIRLASNELHVWFVIGMSTDQLRARSVRQDHGTCCVVHDANETWQMCFKVLDNKMQWPVNAQFRQFSLVCTLCLGLWVRWISYPLQSKLRALTRAPCMILHENICSSTSAAQHWRHKHFLNRCVPECNMVIQIDLTVQHGSNPFGCQIWNQHVWKPKWPTFWCSAATGWLLDESAKTNWLKSQCKLS